MLIVIQFIKLLINQAQPATGLDLAADYGCATACSL